jgi:cytochrome P450
VEVIEGFNPFDADEGPHHFERMAELRARCPVARLDSGMMILSRFDDVKTVLGDPEMSNRNAGRAAGVEVPAADRMFFFEYDPPEHPALRAVVRDLLSRRKATERTEEVRALILELLTPVLEAGGGNVVDDFTAPLTGRLMMRLSGFPEEDAPMWRAWVKDWIRSGFSFTNQNERGTGFAECYPEIFAYVDRHLDQRARSTDRPEDALTCVVEASIDGKPLSRTQQRMIVTSLPPAGGNTMGNFINNTLYSLAQHPDVFERIRADRTLIPNVVEESLRRDSPSMFLSRVCAADKVIVDGPAAKGQKVLLGLASANRDETVYPNALEFSIDRSGQPPHLAFGWGAHTCVGAHVVRHAGATLLDTLLDTVATIEVESGATPVRYVSPQGNGFDELRLRMTRLADKAGPPGQTGVRPATP